MTKRKSFEELAFTKLKRRSKRIRELVEEIAYDFFDSDAGSISEVANRLGYALDEFDKDAADMMDEYREREAADD